MDDGRDAADWAARIYDECGRDIERLEIEVAGLRSEIDRLRCGLSDICNRIPRDDGNGVDWVGEWVLLRAIARRTLRGQQ